MLKHACTKCGLRHKSPTASSVIVALVVGGAYLVVEVFAARALDGWLSVALWVIAGLNVLALTLVIWGVAILATNAMKGQLP